MPHYCKRHEQWHESWSTPTFCAACKTEEDAAKPPKIAPQHLAPNPHENA